MADYQNLSAPELNQINGSSSALGEGTFKRRSITAERLKQVLSYDPDTGIFRWLVGGRRRIKGAVAGTVRYGYRRIMVDGSKYSAHRLAWLFPTSLENHLILSTFLESWKPNLHSP